MPPRSFPLSRLVDMTVQVVIQTEPIDAAALIAKATQSAAPHNGAIASFIGVAREQGQTGHTIHAITLEHYPAMTQHELETIAHNAQKQWQLSAIHIHHRIGTIAVGDVIVVVVTCSPHRSQAFDAARSVMDWLKQDAPFWKCEHSNSGTDSGTHWVTPHRSDYPHNS